MAKRTDATEAGIVPATDDPAFGEVPGEEEARALDDEDRAGTPEQWVEFVGVPPYGREFIGERIISRADAKKGWNDLDPGKDLVWNKENNYRIPVSDLDEEVLDILLTRETGFRRTTKRT